MGLGKFLNSQRNNMAKYKQKLADVKKTNAEAKKVEADAYSTKKKADSDKKLADRDFRKENMRERYRTARFTAATGAISTSASNAARALADWGKIAAGTNDDSQDGNGGASGTTGNSGKINPYTGKKE